MAVFGCRKGLTLFDVVRTFRISSMAFRQAFFGKTRASPAAGKREHSEETTTRIEDKKRHLDVEAPTQKSITFRVQNQVIIFFL
jgi:hypothetical protein